MRLLAIVIISLFAYNSFASQCESVDLRSKLGPILNQDGTGLCYAYTAADLVSYRLGRRVSPVDIALQYTKRRDELLYRSAGRRYLNQITAERDDAIKNGGWVQYALQYSQEEGYCADEKINSNDFRTKRGLVNGLVNLNQLSMRQYSLSSGGDACGKFSDIQKIFPGVSMQELQDTANKSNVMNIGANVADVACEPRMKPRPQFRFKTMANGDRNLTRGDYDRIDRQLSRGNPVALSVYMDKLYNFGGSNSIHKRHGITLAGRKYNPSTGKCEYILKNSWGPECGRAFKVRCEDGYLFVPEDLFKSMVYAADYIE